MNFLRELIGFALVCVAFFNPFGLNFLFRVVLFILGLDLVSLVPKIGFFLFDFLTGFSGLHFFVLLLVAAGFITKFLAATLSLLLKPLVVLFLVFLVRPELALMLSTFALSFLTNLSTLIK